MDAMPGKSAIAAWARLVRVETRILARVHQELRRAKLPPLAWYDVLLELHRSGRAGLRQVEIERETLLPKHNLSRLVDRMERAGAVRRTECPGDKRSNRVVITSDGRKLLRRMWPVYGAVLREDLESRLSAREISSLEAILKKLVDS